MTIGAAHTTCLAAFKRTFKLAEYHHLPAARYTEEVGFARRAGRELGKGDLPAQLTKDKGDQRWLPSELAGLPSWFAPAQSGVFRAPSYIGNLRNLFVRYTVRGHGRLTTIAETKQQPRGEPLVGEKQEAP